MDHQELHEALEWLRRAVAVGETALLSELAPEVREEWLLALEKKRALLQKLEQLNHALLATAPTPTGTNKSPDARSNSILSPNQGVRAVLLARSAPLLLKNTQESRQESFISTTAEPSMQTRNAR